MRMAEQPWRTRLQRSINEAVRQIVEGYDPDRVIVFGSVARGDVHEDSDLDLLVVKRTDRPFLRRIDEVMALIDVPIAVHVLVYTPEELDRLALEGRDFIRTALEEGRSIYERPGQPERAGSTPVAQDRPPRR